MKKIYILSFVITIIVAFIPKIGIMKDGDYTSFGFPTQWLKFYKGDFITFGWIGFLLNFFIFTLVLYLISKLLKKKK
ncbi:hypothetical protein ABEY69_25395 [Priestia filamentosa]|uniref:hypothetical protein n=1 Tax=Priestia filamentosa TaxID=1402861 RepID=UPI003D28DB79